MRFVRRAAMAGVALFLCAAAPAPTQNFYSPWLSPQLYGMLPEWPHEASNAQASVDAVHEFWKKADVAFARYSADYDRNTAAAQAMGSQEDDSSDDWPAWRGLADRKDFNDADLDKLEALYKKMIDIETHFGGQADDLDHQLYLAERDDHLTCDQNVAKVHEVVTKNYTIAQQENEALKGVYDQMRATVQQMVRREERWATAFAQLHPLHKLTAYSQMSDLQHEAMNASKSISSNMEESLRTHIVPLVEARDRMNADHRSCH